MILCLKVLGVLMAGGLIGGYLEHYSTDGSYNTRRKLRARDRAYNDVVRMLHDAQLLIAEQSRVISRSRAKESGHPSTQRPALALIHSQASSHPTHERSSSR